MIFIQSKKCDSKVFFQISKLRGQVINRATDSELEKRLRALTETLIEKQQSIEGLSADKTTLGLELERLKADKSRQVRILRTGFINNRFLIR